MTTTEQTGVTNTIILQLEEVKRLEELYAFKNPAEILQFLQKYPILVSLMLDAYGTIRKYFPDAPLFLQYAPDPEIDDPQLAVCISTDLDSEEAFERLDKFEAEWYTDNPKRDRDKMFFTFDWLKDDDNDF